MLFVAIGFLAGALGFAIGWTLAHRLALPAAQTLAGFGAFAFAWSDSGPGGGALAVLSWAAGTTIVSLPTFVRKRAETDRRVLRAVPYREEMLAWLETGRGPESRPLGTALAHLRELAVYAAAAFLTANLLSIAMGAVLLNYMNAYVARLLAAARRPWVVRLLAWNVWSLLRVGAFVLLGSALAAPFARAVGRPAPPGEVAPLLVAGSVGVALDLALKLLLSRPCGRLLAAAVDLDAASGRG